MESQRIMVEIMRPVSGLHAEPGSIVDATDWLNLRFLERQQFVRRAFVPSAEVIRGREGKRHAATA